VEQIVHSDSHHVEGQIPSPEESDTEDGADISTQELSNDESGVRNRRLIRKMRFQGCSLQPVRHMLVADTLL